jgi:hypothetical protein
MGIKRRKPYRELERVLAMNNIVFSIVVLLILADGLVLLISPPTHAVMVNRWNALLRIPARINVEAYHGARWRLTGAILVAFCAYVLAKTWRLA